MATATFNTPYGPDSRNGETVTVIGDVIIGDNYLVAVRFADGETAEVWPEEIGGPMPTDHGDLN